MKVIKKDELKDILIQKSNQFSTLKKSEQKMTEIFSELVEELYNVKEPIVYPLNEKNTYLIRKKYGIFNNGMPQTFASIGEEFGLTRSRIEQMYDKVIETLLKTRILELKTVPLSKIKMSSANLSKDEDIKNIKIGSLQITDHTFTSLQKYHIDTLEDLLTYSLQDLKRILSESVLTELHIIVNNYDLKFIEELSPKEKIQIIYASSLQQIMNSSISFIAMSDYAHKKINNHSSMCNIVSLEYLIEIINQNKLPSVVRRSLQDVEKIIAQTDELHFTSKEKRKEKEEPFTEILEKNISDIEVFTEKTIEILTNYKITKVKELIQLDIDEIKNIIGMTPKKYQRILDWVHQKGLLFVNEQSKIQYYSSSIYEMLSTTPKTEELLLQYNKLYQEDKNKVKTLKKH